MIVQLSTGGRSGAGRERGGMLPLRPDMASLTVGSNNFPTRVYENPPDLVDWLAAEMLAHDVHQARDRGLRPQPHLPGRRNGREGQLAGTPYVQFVMGVKNAMPADREVFDFYVKTVQRLAPDAQWCAAGIGANQIVLNEWASRPAGTRAPGWRTMSASTGDAGALQRRACAAGGRDLRQARAPGGGLAAGAGDAGPEAGGGLTRAAVLFGPPRP
jgi:3-keto-5-aminohexanoate cleavage enzyme